MTDAKKMALLACEALEDKKASDIKVIDIEQITTLADYFIIASGSNRNQVQAMADNVDEVLGKPVISSNRRKAIPVRTGSCWTTVTS